MTQMQKELIDAITALGGTPSLRTMIGAKDYCYSSKDNFVAFKWSSRLTKHSNYVRITYNAGHDSFDLEFMKLRNLKSTLSEVALDVQIGELKKVFTEVTGLELNVPRILRAC